MMPTCTVCEQECERGSSYVAVIEQGGILEYRWGCEHHPIGDAAIFLGSQECLEEWLETQPLIMTEAWNEFRKAGTVC